MELNTAQKTQLRNEGFLKVENVVPRIMVDAAVRAINHAMGQGMNPADIPTFAAQSYCPALVKTPVITDLLNGTPALSLAESAIGTGAFFARMGQIALRFPVTTDPPRAPGAHIDGTYTSTNGVKEGSIDNFTALLGVMLSDVNTEFAGNFSVWPGSHLLHEKYFREKGPEALLKGMPQIDIGKPLQITGKAGDIVLAHYLLGHGITPNVSPHIRYMIFFRLRRHDHDSQRWESMTNAWLQWEGMKAIS